LFSLGTHQAKLLSELQFPCVDINLSIVKYDSISSSPDHPTCSYEKFSKNGEAKVGSGYNHHVKGWQVQVPSYGDAIPTFLTEGTFEEQIKACLLLTFVAPNTTIIIKRHIFSLRFPLL